MRTYHFHDPREQWVRIQHEDAAIEIIANGPVSGRLGELEAATILPYVPASCGPAQARIVLWEMGLLDAVEAMVVAHPYKPVSIWYQHATIWERDHPYVMALAMELGLTDEQVDDLFRQAASL